MDEELDLIFKAARMNVELIQEVATNNLNNIDRAIMQVAALKAQEVATNPYFFPEKERVAA